MTTRETIDAYFTALATGAGWERYFAADVTFTSFTAPVRELRGHEAFLGGTRRFYGSIRSTDVRRIIVEGDHAVALTRYRIEPPGGRAAFQSDVAEVFDVRDGKIVAFGIYFDTAPYPK